MRQRQEVQALPRRIASNRRRLLVRLGFALVALAVAGGAPRAIGSEPAAAASSGATAVAVFRVTLEAEVSKRWTSTGPPATEDPGCRRVEKADGERVVRFASRSPLRLVVPKAAAGASSVGPFAIDVRGVDGVATTSGSAETRVTCEGGEGRAQIADCIQTVKRFRGASVHFFRRPSGTVVVSRLRGAGVGPGQLCPPERVSVRALEPGLEQAEGRIPQPQLVNPRVRTILATGTLLRTTPLRAPESGQVEVSVRWKLTLRRESRGAGG